MIGYTMVGTNDFEKAKSFYDAVLADLGGKRSSGGRAHARLQRRRQVAGVLCLPAA